MSDFDHIPDERNITISVKTLEHRMSNLLGKATDAQHDEIYDLIDKLPSQFFGDNFMWQVTARRLADVMDEIENGKSDREILDSVCELLQCERTEVYSKIRELKK